MGSGWGLWLWAAAAAWTSASGEVFTSVAGLQKLLSEASPLADLAEYVAGEEERLAQISQLLQTDASRKLLQDTHLEPFNPVQAFAVIKNAVHLKEAALGLVEGAGLARALVAARLEAGPEEADVEGAAAALFRLQDTYNLTAEEMAEGRLPGLPSPSASAALSADDAFHLGYSAAQAADFYHALPWMAHALRKSRQEDRVAEDPEAAPGHLAGRSFNESNLYDYLAYSLYEQGNPEWAAFYARARRDADPSYPAAENLAVYEEAMRKASSTWDGSEAALPAIRNERDTDSAFLENEKLCRGEERTTEAQRKRLVCFLRRDSPFAFLAPLKAELLHRRPDLLLFHQVLSQREVQHLQDIATPTLRRAMVIKEEGKEALSRNASSTATNADGDIASFRIAQSTFVQDSQDPKEEEKKELAKVVERISRRVEAFSGLTTEFAETLQIANYGLGGHYEPHYDMSTEAHPKGLLNEECGNRIATALFYLAAPAAGGRTAFGQLGLAVRPLARAAAFWMNVRRVGSPDLRTRHAACPVLAGTKWVANKWLHEFGQERARPCPLRRAALFDRLPPPVFSPREHRHRAPYHSFVYQTSAPTPHLHSRSGQKNNDKYQDQGTPATFHTKT